MCAYMADLRGTSRWSAPIAFKKEDANVFPAIDMSGVNGIHK